MESKIKQKKWFAAIGVALALLMATVGIPVGISASAAETAEIQPMSTYYPDSPIWSAGSGYAAAWITYQGDRDFSPNNSRDTYIAFGSNTNVGSVTKTAYGNRYTEVSIPIVGSYRIRHRYFWARTYSKVNNTWYSSPVVYLSNNEVFTSKYTVLASLTNGTVTAGKWYTITANLSGRSTVYCSLVYAGVCYDFSVDVGQSGTANRGGKVISYQSTTSYIKIKSPWSFTCAQFSSSDSTLGGIAIGA